MLYIASALEASAVTHSIVVPSFTAPAYDPESSSLVVAKGKIVEIWDVKPEGLVKVCETDVWGMVVGLCWVGDVKAGQQPHIVVLTDHPLTRLLLYCYEPPHPPSPTGNLLLTSHHWLDRLSRTSEFLTTLISDPATGLVIASMYAGILSVLEIAPKRPGEDEEDGGMEVEMQSKKITPSKRNGKGKRKESLVADGVAEEGDVEESVPVWGPMTFREKHDINVREHNLLSMAMITASSESSSPPSSKPLLALLYLTPDYDIHLIARSYDRSTRSFKDRSAIVDVRAPALIPVAGQHRVDSPGSLRLSGDFSVPAAKHLLALPSGEGVLVIGDEYSASYSLVKTKARSTSGSHSAGRRESMNMSTSASAGSTGRTSPEVKRRKASTGGSFVPSAAGSSTHPSSGIASKTDGKDAYSWKRGIRFRQGFGEVSAFTATEISATTAAVFVGDAGGRLTMVTYDKASPASAVTYPLGMTSSPSSLTYLDDGYLFAASISGDSHVLRISSRSLVPSTGLALSVSPQRAFCSDDMQVDDDAGPSSGTQAFDIVDTWTNIAPVRDMCVVRQQGSDDSQIVTASGLGPSGSLRIVKSGVGMEEIAVIDGIGGAVSIFPIGSVASGNADTAILVSTADATRVLRLDGETEDTFSISEAFSDAYLPFRADERTLAAGTTADGSFIQITSTGIYLVPMAGSGQPQEWTPTLDVLHGCLLPGLAVVALAGGVVTLLEISTGQIRVMSESAVASSEVASLDAMMEADQIQGLVAIGLWGEDAIRLLAIPSLRPLDRVINQVTLPTSLRFRQSSSGVFLSVGLGNGTLANYALTADYASNTASVVQRKDLIVGRSPVALQPRRLVETEDGLLISISDRTSIIFAEQDRLSCSAIGARDVSTANTISTRALGEVLVIGTLTGLSMLRITSLKNLHIRKIDLGADAPIGIAHDSRSGTYAVALNRSVLDPETGAFDCSSCIRLYDDTSMAPVFEVVMPDNSEELVSLNQVTLDGSSYFAATSVFPGRPNDAGSASLGGLKLYSVNTGADPDVQPSMSQVAGIILGGTVYDVKAIWGHLAVAVDHRVVLYKLDLKDATVPLHQISEWGNAMFASCLTVQTYRDPRTGLPKERLHVGDGMRSVFSVELGSNDTMIDVGRDMRPHWIVSMAELAADDGAVIFADTSYNVLTIKHANNRMENAAALALHEVISAFAPGSIVPPGVSTVKSELLFATSSGRLGVIADLGAKDSKLLVDLQRNMESVVNGPGIDWRKYREVHTEGTAMPRQTAGFVDGDFVKHFLRHSNGIEEIMRGQNEFTRISRADGQKASRDDVVQALEAVGALH